MNWKNRIRRWARAIKQEIIALWFAVRAPRIPLLPKVLCTLVLAYALRPIDLIPDFIPILGFVDDALLLPGLIWLVIETIPKDVLTECRQKARVWMNTGGARPKSLLGAAAIVLLWLAALGLGLFGVIEYLRVKRGAINQREEVR